MARTWFIRDRLRRISPSKGICPPTSPVLPPCGTTAVFVSWQMARIAETSDVAEGFSNRGELPLYLLRHSSRCGFISAESSEYPFLPAACFSRAVVSGFMEIHAARRRAQAGH